MGNLSMKMEFNGSGPVTTRSAFMAGVGTLIAPPCPMAGKEMVLCGIE